MVYAYTGNNGREDSTTDEARSSGDETGEWLGNPSNAVVVTCVGGEERQQASAKSLVHLEMTSKHPLDSYLFS